ncbi:hypothetical protein PI124_g8322 [Phytophthora idaei]|nr:hypothetical protein PI125_g8208 [Phytophthora idaei]KAG3159153.1 hypothetical protein PI126_g7537 [Phytophthora idaei]KAG3246970.1 hypothetical protein PI124_g8322 [Phytophthora idaei]
MSTTNKGFSYIFNTSKEDHKIAKVLSGYKPKAAVALQNLFSFYAQTRDAIDRLQGVLFVTCYKVKTDSLNVNKKGMDVLTARVFRYFWLLKGLNCANPAVKRVEAAVAHSDCSLAEHLVWSSRLATLPASYEEFAAVPTAKPMRLRIRLSATKIHA